MNEQTTVAVVPAAMALTGISKNYDGVAALTGVDLTIRSGETHAIMGPNGSGKSTTAYAIAGHPKYKITKGSVTLDGEEVFEYFVDERALIARLH